MALCQLFDLYSLPLLSTIVHGVFELLFVKTNDFPGGIEIAAAGITFSTVP